MNNIDTLHLFQSSVAFIELHEELEQLKILKKMDIEDNGSSKFKKSSYSLRPELITTTFCIIIKILSNKYLLIEEKMEVEDQAMKIIKKLKFANHKDNQSKKYVDFRLIKSLIMMSMKEKQEYQNFIQQVIERVYLIHFKE